MPTGKQQPAVGLALDVARFVNYELAKRRMSHAQLAKLIDRSANYTSERVRGDKVFNLQDLDRLSGVFGLVPEELILRARNEHLAGYEGALIPRFGMVMSTRKGLEVYQVPGSSVPMGHWMDDALDEDGLIPEIESGPAAAEDSSRE